MTKSQIAMKVAKEKGQKVVNIKPVPLTTTALLVKQNDKETDKQVVKDAKVLHYDLTQFRNWLRNMNYESPVTRLNIAIEELDELIYDLS